MRKILFAALAAVASAASHRNSLVRWENENVLFSDASPATMLEFKINYDFDFGYGVAVDQEPAGEDQDGPLIIDNWVQFELWSDANFGFTFNLFGIHLAQVNVNLQPFHIVPWWFSIYHTHPVRVAAGDPMHLFTEMGYELAFGDVQLQYAPSTLLPHVSILDFILGNGDILPSNIFQSVADINARTDAGWEYKADIGDLKDDPYLYFSLLDFLFEAIQSPIDTAGAYFTLNFIGDASNLFY
jgi:hypothetical protein